MKLWLKPTQDGWQITVAEFGQANQNGDRPLPWRSRYRTMTKADAEEIAAWYREKHPQLLEAN